MKDNFDLKKFLAENKTIENSNPFLKEEKEIPKKEKKSLKKISKQLKKSVKAHGVQAKTIDKVLKESEAGELNVYGYQTQHFDICPSATSLFKRILDGEFGDLSEIAIKNMAKINDQLFLLEKSVVEKEQASEYQVNLAKMAQQALINLALQMGIPEEEFDYVQAHVDKIKSFSNLKEEMSDSEKEKVDKEVDAVRDDLDQISKLAKDAGEDAGDIKSKIREMIINELTNVTPDPEDLGGYNPEFTDDTPLPKLPIDDDGEYLGPPMTAEAEEGLEEAKKDEEEEVETEEESEEEIDTETEETEEEPESEGGIEDIAADMEGDEGDLMDHLISALKVSKAMDNDKLTTQIGNTLKFFVGEYIGGEE